MDNRLERLSLNQITTERWSLSEAVEGCARAGIPNIGLWRHKVAEVGTRQARQLVCDARLQVSSLCRGGFFPAASAVDRHKALDDNRRAVEEAAELGAPVLVLVAGPAPDRNLAAARTMVAEGLAELVPHAQACGVRLGIEPLHPMQIDRSVVVTLEQANALVAPFDPALVGVVIDAFHVWWDPQLDAEIERARGRIFGFHVSDWLTPLPDPFMGRGLMGDGVIDLRRMRAAVDAAGYGGAVEVEIFNKAVWDTPGSVVFEEIKARYVTHVAGWSSP